MSSLSFLTDIKAAFKKIFHTGWGAKGGGMCSGALPAYTPSKDAKQIWSITTATCKAVGAVASALGSAAYAVTK